LKIDFRDKSMAELVNDYKRLVRTLNVERAKRLRRRLDDLAAAANLAVMRGLPGRLHELKGSKSHDLSIDLDGPYRLILVPSDDPIPLKKDGGLDWSGVTMVTIQRIEDTHE
jgi:plasmid maintenance system killer protein